MRKKTLWIVIAALVGTTGVVLILCSGIGYYAYQWLQVGPIDVVAGASEAERLAAVERWLDEQFEQHKFNGGVLVARDGKVLLTKTCGYTDHTASERLDEHSAFRLASVSKQFTAAGILRLAEMGKLHLDDPVASHLDGFISDAVTVRHLLNHTSGVPDIYMDLAEEHRKDLGEVLTIEDVVALVQQYGEMERAPGEAMEYSNTNYVLLAGVVESASGMRFQQFMHDELFAPLGMDDTRVWNLVSDERSSNQAGDFAHFMANRTEVEPTWIDGVAGDGAVFCSLHDFVIWDRFWEGNPLVSDELLQEATRRPELNDGTESNYGFGWVIQRKRHWHNGAWLGAQTYVARYPESRCFLVVLDNSSNVRLGDIIDRLEDALEPILEEDE